MNAYPARPSMTNPWKRDRTPRHRVSLCLRSLRAPRRGAGNGELWSAQDEQYYGQSNGSGESRSHRWRYPANFDEQTRVPR
jgi:hypothetical protein